MAGAGDHEERAPDAPYRVIDTRARARAGLVYLGMACMAGIVTVASGTSPMWLTAVVPIGAIGAFHIATAWSMPVSDGEAIRIAATAVSFGFGHGSATLGYRGVLAKPVWQVLVFSDTPSPDHQALVTVDAMTGDVTGVYEEVVDAP